LQLAIAVNLSGAYTWLHNEIVPPALPQAWARLNVGPAAVPLEHIPVLGPHRGHASSFRFCEDATHWPGNVDAVIVSCDRWRKAWNTVLGPMTGVGAQGKGSLWVVRPGEDKVVASEVELVGWPNQFEFHPLGLDVAPDGETMLVVNHRASESTIEVFTMKSPVQGEQPKAQVNQKPLTFKGSYTAD